MTGLVCREFFVGYEGGAQLRAHRSGFAGFGIEADHHRLADGADFACRHLDETLLEREATVAEAYAARHDLYLLSEADLLDITAIYICYYAFYLTPVYLPFPHRLQETGLCKIIEGEIYYIVKMAENIDIVESQLYRLPMVEIGQIR